MFIHNQTFGEIERHKLACALFLHSFVQATEGTTPEGVSDLRCYYLQSL